MVAQPAGVAPVVAAGLRRRGHARVRTAEHAAQAKRSGPAAGEGSRTALVLADRALVIRRNMEPSTR